jgi:DNA-binding response OmpR family regulator
MRDKPTEQRPTHPPLRLLIVEDEALISMLIENTVRELGHEPAACAYNVRDALNFVDEMPERPIDAAMLDVNLGGSLVFPVAEALSERGVPFAFLTGYGTCCVPVRYSDALVMEKPFSEDDLAFALATLGAHNAARASAKPVAGCRRLRETAWP